MNKKIFDQKSTFTFCSVTERPSCFATPKMASFKRSEAKTSVAWFSVLLWPVTFLNVPVPNAYICFDRWSIGAQHRSASTVKPSNSPRNQPLTTMPAYWVQSWRNPCRLASCPPWKRWGARCAEMLDMKRRSAASERSSGSRRAAPKTWETETSWPQTRFWRRCTQVERSVWNVCLYVLFLFSVFRALSGLHQWQMRSRASPHGDFTHGLRRRVGHFRLLLGLVEDGVSDTNLSEYQHSALNPSSAQTRRGPARLLTLVASTKHLNPAAETINSSLPEKSG